MIGRIGPGVADTDAIVGLSEDSIYDQTRVRHVLDGRRAIVAVVRVAVAQERRKASEPLQSRAGDAPTAGNIGVFPLVLMPDRDVNVTMRRTPGLPRYQARVVADLENLVEFASLVGIPAGFLRIRIGVMGACAEHDLGVRSVYGKRAEPVGRQRYGCVGNVIEVDEVCPEVFERKEVVRRNREDPARAKPKDISEFLLYPELSDGRLGLPEGRGSRVKRSELREQRLGRKLGAYGVALEEIKSKHRRCTCSAAKKGPCATKVEVVAGGFVLGPEGVARLLVEGRIGDAVIESVLLGDVCL